MIALHLGDNGIAIHQIAILDGNTNMTGLFVPHGTYSSSLIGCVS